MRTEISVGKRASSRWREKLLRSAKVPVPHSPGPLLRQYPNRYAIRAGRNLPDKEFRYLRTVIVTAAVYWGFGSMLRLL